MFSTFIKISTCWFSLFKSSSSSSPVSDFVTFSNYFLDSLSLWSAINVSISFSIGKFRPPICLATGTKRSTSFSMTRKLLKLRPCCFLRSRWHPSTLWVLIALTLWETLENWDRSKAELPYINSYCALYQGLTLGESVLAVLQGRGKRRGPWKEAKETGRFGPSFRKIEWSKVLWGPESSLGKC